MFSSALIKKGYSIMFIHNGGGSEWKLVMVSLQHVTVYLITQLMAVLMRSLFLFLSSLAIIASS